MNNEKLENGTMKALTQKEAQVQNERAVREEYVAPEVNILETKDGYVLEAEMPGVNKDGLQVLLEGTELTLVGRRQTETAPGEALLRESSTLDYRRIFELDPAIDSSKISAKMDQGILTLTLPKSDRVKPRRISVD
jgi:HSP20 family protein